MNGEHLAQDVRVDLSETAYYNPGNAREEQIYLYKRKRNILCDLSIGWKPEEAPSDYGLLGKLHDLPGRVLYPKYRPNETDRCTTSKEWKKLRGPWRHYTAFFLLWGPPGNLFYNMRVPLLVTGIITLANAIYGTVGELITSSLPHWFGGMGARSSSFSMTSFLVSLLLGFKVNRSYDRWWLARQTYSTVCSRVSGILTSISLEKSKDMAAHDNDKDKMKIYNIQRLLQAFPYTLIMALHSLDRAPVQARNILDKSTVHWLENTKDAWYFLLCKVEILISGLSLKKASDIQKEVSHLRVEVNSLLTIKRTNLPYFLSKIPTALLMVYSVLVPMALFADLMDFIENNPEYEGSSTKNILHYWYLASVTLVFTSLILAANEASDLLEDPFYYIPLHNIADAELGKSTKLIHMLDPDHKVMFLASKTRKADDDDDDDDDSLERTNTWFFGEE